MPDPGVPGDHDPDETSAPADPSAADESPVDEPATFQNRAARRAKGKGGAQQQPQGKGKHFGGRGSVPGQRQWGNRRSG
jgi:hypothetical protein